MSDWVYGSDNEPLYADAHYALYEDYFHSPNATVADAAGKAIDAMLSWLTVRYHSDEYRAN